MKTNNKNITEFIMLGIIITVFIYSSLSETSNLTLIPKILILHFTDNKSLFLTLFQVQASVSTIGIAITALISNLSKEIMFGIPVSRYIMIDRPKIFKHHISIILELLLIVVGYILLSFNLYNILICVFFTSVFILINMIYDMFQVFFGNQKTDDQMFSFYQEKYFKALTEKNDFAPLNYMSNEIRKTLLENKGYDFLKNIDFIERLFSQVIKSPNLYTQKANDINAIYADVLNYIFVNGTESQIVRAYLFLLNSYKECNEYNKEKKEKKIVCSLFDEIDLEFYKSLSKIKISQLRDKYILTSIKEQLYKNISFLENDKKKQLNCYSLKNYTANIYYRVLRGNEDVIDPQVYKFFGKELFDSTVRLIKYKTVVNNKEKDNIAYMEMLLFIKALIQEQDELLLAKTFILYIDFNSNKKTEGDKLLIFKTLIYLYYLGYFEKLASDKMIEFSKKFLERNERAFQMFFDSEYRFSQINVEFIDDIKEELWTWEVMPEENAKTIIIDYVIETFFVMLMISKYDDMKTLQESLKEVIGENAFSYYSSFAGPKKTKTMESLRNFLKVFYGKDETSMKYQSSELYTSSNDVKTSKEIFEEYLRITVDRLEWIILSIYKDTKLKESRKFISEPLESYRHELENKAFDMVKKQVEYFNANVSGNSIKSFNESILIINTEVSFLTAEYGDKFELEQIKSLFTQNVIYLLLPQTVYSHIDHKSRQILNEFFKELETSKVIPDTLIGYKDWFTAEDETLRHRFKEFEGKMQKVTAEQCHNIIMSVDSKKVYFLVKNLSISIEKYTEKEIFENENIFRREDGIYEYKIQSDISLPFEKNELIEYFNNQKIRINISVNLEYGFTDKCVGNAVIIDFKE